MSIQTNTEQPALAAPSGSRDRVDEMADYLARAIFLAGHGPDGDKTQRIAFKGGRYRVAETDLGGFCQSALEDWIAQAIRARLPLFTENTEVCNAKGDS